jgi:AmmeMemoRadiSam system protein A
MSESNQGQSDVVLSTAERAQLLTLARSVIGAQLDESIQVRRPERLTAAMAEKRGCFVTLNIGEALRGCIGTLKPHRSLIDTIEENALNAAFRDPRFAPLTRTEFDRVQIEISVLSVPQPLPGRSAEDRLNFVEPRIHGVILSKAWHSATFLPQVWKQLPDKVQFLEHLCIKAGLPPDGWQDPAVEMKVYTVEYFSE